MNTLLFVTLYCRDSKPRSESTPGMSNKKSFKNDKKNLVDLWSLEHRKLESILALTFQAEKVI